MDSTWAQPAARQPPIPRKDDAWPRRTANYPTLHPRPGWEELDAKLVLKRVWECIAETAQGTAGDPVTALSISTMGEAMTPVSSEREILGNSILSVDLRGAEYVRQLEDEIGQQAFYAINPNILAPNYSLPKLMWLRANEPALYDRTWKFLLWGDLVAFMLGCEPLTSHSHANRTLLFDIRKEIGPNRCSSGPASKERNFRSVHRRNDCRRSERCRGGGIGFTARCCRGRRRTRSMLQPVGRGRLFGGKAVCGIGTVECITPAYAEFRMRRRCWHTG